MTILKADRNSTVICCQQDGGNQTDNFKTQLKPQQPLICPEGTTVLSVARFNHTLRKLTSTASIHHPLSLVTYEYVILQFLTWHGQTQGTLCCDFAHLAIQECLSGTFGSSLSSSAFHPPRWLAAQGSDQSGLDIHPS